MPRITPIALRPYANPAKPAYRFRLPIPAGLRPLTEGVATKFFKTKKEGEGFAKWLEMQKQKYGEAAMSMSDEHRVDAIRALAILEPYGITLTGAAKAAADAAKAASLSVTGRVMTDAFTTALAADGADPEHVRAARSRLRRFENAFGDDRVSTITAPALDQWLRGLSDPAITRPPLAAATRNGLRTYLRICFEYARRQGWVKSNIVVDTVTATSNGKAVSILTVDQMKALLDAAAPLGLMPYFALGAFAGLRPSEAARATWSDIKFERGIIDIDSHDPRSYSRRWVSINPTLKAWLEPYRLASVDGLVAEFSDQQLNDRRRQAAEAAGIVPWPKDALRHSFASYHLAHHQDIPALMTELGHSQPRMLSAHYRERVEPAVAAAWWAILPTP